MDDLELLHDDEYQIMEVRRYRPFILGIVGVWALAEALIAGAFYMVHTYYHAVGKDSLYLGLLAVAILIVVIGYAFIQTYIRNRLIITNSRIIITTQHGLLGQRIDQCGLEFIQDVSSDHRNLIAVILDYGNVHVETSGNDGSFSFSACPQPKKVVALIVKMCRQKKQVLHHSDPSVSLEASPRMLAIPKQNVSLDADFELPKPPFQAS
jgi:hypothetical protein